MGKKYQILPSPATQSARGKAGAREEAPGIAEAGAEITARGETVTASAWKLRNSLRMLKHNPLGCEDAEVCDAGMDSWGAPQCS